MVAALVLGIGAAAGFTVTPRRLADASTLVLMTDSLRFDGDLRYDPHDLVRAKALGLGDLPAGLMLLEPTPGSYVYAKPVLYPILALPWYAALGVRGFFVMNGVLLGILALAGAALLAPRTGWTAAFAIALGVHALSVGPIYLHWIDPFLPLSALVALGLLAHRRGLVGASGAAFGALVSYRFPYLAPAVVPLALHLGARRVRAAAYFGVAAATTWLVLAAVTVASTGQWSSYTGPRFYFPTEVPFERSGDVGVP